MTLEERTAFVHSFFNEHCLKVMQSKGKEYSRSEVDVNSNFKRLSAELFSENIKINPEGVCYIYMKKHWDAITNYIKMGQVESEPIAARIGDAINYLFILASLIEERKEALKMPRNREF